MALPQIGSKFTIIQNLRRLLEELLGLKFRFGIEPAASFMGAPKQRIVVLSKPFEAVDYSIAFAVRTTDGKTAYAPTFTNKTTTGFTINLNTSDAGSLMEVTWIAIKI